MTSKEDQSRSAPATDIDATHDVGEYKITEIPRGWTNLSPPSKEDRAKVNESFSDACKKLDDLADMMTAFTTALTYAESYLEVAKSNGDDNMAAMVASAIPYLSFATNHAMVLMRRATEYIKKV